MADTMPAAAAPVLVRDDAQPQAASASAGHEADHADLQAQRQAPGLSRRSVEFGVALVLTALAGLVIWDNLRIGAGWGDSGPQAGYFPLRVGVALGACGVAVFWQAMRESPGELFATWLQLKRVVQVLVPLTVYVALIAPLGIYVASAIFIAAFMVFAGRYAWWKAVLTGVVVNLFMFYIFELQFMVPLPKGPLEAWLGV
jgi:hypothetical protein